MHAAATRVFSGVKRQKSLQNSYATAACNVHRLVCNCQNNCPIRPCASTRVTQATLRQHVVSARIHTLHSCRSKSAAMSELREKWNSEFYLVFLFYVRHVNLHPDDFFHGVVPSLLAGCPRRAFICPASKGWGRHGHRAVLVSKPEWMASVEQIQGWLKASTRWIHLHRLQRLEMSCTGNSFLKRLFKT